MHLKPKVLKNTKVLVADDSPLVLSNVKLLLREIGFSTNNIYTAKDSRLMIKLLSEEMIELIICDFNFGDDLNGKQIYEEIEYLDLVPPWCTFIMLTGEKNMEHVRSIVDLEPDEYIVKPYSVFLLKKRILRAFSRKLVLRDLYELTHESNINEIEQAFDFAEQLHPQFHSFLKKLHGSILIKNKFYLEAKKLYLSSINEHMTLWGMSGLITACLNLGTYDDAEKYLTEWGNSNYVRSPLLHESLAKLHLLNGNYKEALSEIKMAYQKAQNMDRLLNYARICELNQQYNKAQELFSQYRILARRTYRDGQVNHLNVIRNTLLSVSDSNEQNPRILRMVSKELKRFDYIQNDASSELADAIELFDIHSELIFGNHKLFRSKLYMVAKRFSQLDSKNQLHCVLLARIGQQTDLSCTLLARMQELSTNEVDFESLVWRSQFSWLKEQCHAEKLRLLELKKTWQTTNEESRIKGIELAFELYQSRKQCPSMSNLLLKSMEYGFPIALSSLTIRRLIFDCEKVIQESFILNKDERIEARQSAHKVKILFNERLANQV